MSRYTVRHDFHLPGGGAMKQRGDVLTFDEVEAIRENEPSLLDTNCTRSGSLPEAAPAPAPAQPVKPAPVFPARADDAK